MLKPKEKEGARGICRCKSPAQIHKPYLFLTLSTAFLELANHSAAQVAQCAFLESWEQLAGALSTRDRTFAFAYFFFFFHQEKQVRESPGLGGWEAEGKNPFGPSLGNRDRSLLIVLVRQTSVQRTVHRNLHNSDQKTPSQSISPPAEPPQQRYTFQISERGEDT